MVVPLVLVDLVTSNYPQLSTAFMANIQMYVAFLGGMIVASSTLEAFYRPGTHKRMLFGLSTLAFVCLWFFAVFGGGIAQFSYPPYFIRFDISKIVYIIIVGLSLKSLLVVQTFRTWKHAEVERARKQRAEAEARKAAPARRVVRRVVGASSFESMTRVEYKVTADDEIGVASRLPAKSRGTRGTECPVCSLACAPGDLVCKNCGAWLKHGKIK